MLLQDNPLKSHKDTDHSPGGDVFAYGGSVTVVVLLLSIVDICMVGAYVIAFT